MTAEPRLPDYLRHMQEAAQNILRYTAGMDKAALLEDDRTQQAAPGDPANA